MNDEKRKFINCSIFPLVFLIIIWLIKIFEILNHVSFVKYGIYPLRAKNLLGIIFSPLIHADISHLYANSISFLILTMSLFYFYKEIAIEIFFMIYFISGIMLWLGGREAYHIGASGIIYGLAAFIFFSGLIRKNKNLMAMSLLVSFLYGGIIWWLLPIDEKISWEAHLFGFIIGLLLAFFYRTNGTTDTTNIDEQNDDDNDDFTYLDEETLNPENDNKDI